MICIVKVNILEEIGPQFVYLEDCSMHTISWRSLLFYREMSEAMAEDSCSPYNSSSDWWRSSPQVKVNCLWSSSSSETFSISTGSYLERTTLSQQSFCMYRFPYVENPTGLPERTNEVAGAYAEACVEVGKECRIPTVNLWTKMQEFPDWGKAYLR